MTLYTADETKRSVFSAQLKEQLKHKRMIYTKDQLDLSTTVGQGMSNTILVAYSDRIFSDNIRIAQEVFITGSWARYSPVLSNFCT